MADSNAAVMIRWGNPMPGREGKSLDVFMEALGWFGKQKAAGKIADVHTYITTTGDMHTFGGFLTLEGEVAQLRALLDTEEYQTLLLKARHLAEHVEVVHCVGGTELQKQIERIVAVRKTLGIT